MSLERGHGLSWGQSCVAQERETRAGGDQWAVGGRRQGWAQPMTPMRRTRGPGRPGLAPSSPAAGPVVGWAQPAVHRPALQSVEGEQHEKAVELLKAAQGSVKLVVRYTPRVLEEMEARFEKMRSARRRQQHQSYS